MEKARTRLGKFDKWGYKNSFSKGELARELTYMNEDYADLQTQLKKQQEINKKAIEYITSYESINTIQGLENIETNKQLDEKTMTEMTNRYLLVHDKLLQILEDKEV